MESKTYHESVMVREVVEQLHINTSSKIIDATLGNGGHSLEIIKSGGEVLGIEMDPKMLEIVRKRLEKEIAKGKAKFVLGNFTNIRQIAKENNFEKVDGIIFDLGVTNLHLKGQNRGFSFSNSNLKSDLDMRLNEESQGVTASDLLNVLREDQLNDLFEVTMDRGSAKWLSKQVIEKRPIATISDFLKVCSGLRSKPNLNSATLPFLALRIAVNSELDNLKKVLPDAYDLLDENGVLAVISFHSGEDKIVKDFFKTKGRGELILPREDEINVNPKARSAKLRIIKK